MTRDDLVTRAKAILAEAYEEAAEMIVLYLERHPGEQLQTLCKDIDPDNWNGLRHKVQRAQEARKASVGAEGMRPARTMERATRAARQVLRQTPAIVTELPVAEQREIAKQLDNAAAQRQAEAKAESKRKEREHLGDEVVDSLELREELQRTEYLLIKARGELRGFVKQIGEIGLENAPDAWRESCLDWIEDLEGHLGMARALLTDGATIDMAAFEEMMRDA